jgi:tetratricopeptide (TPR) repeat protein
VKTFDEIIGIDPDDTVAYLTKGAALFKSGQIDPAVEALNNVVKRDPEEAAAWYYKSCAEAKKGNLKPVVPFLTRAIDMEEDFRERAKTDECFAPVKDTPEFKALFE